ncbi:hypothetical protein BDV3_000626 [Batrachochytrium dendrobatidis]|uniref:Iron hydrogenase small subunit domain-containing protein n=1 Tax=Batrachochytrium dendrobatidis (strain JEL423) TaxID=403673 RepID=A0A177W8B2_BATDL|nr:hypothetical protein BDEG_20184 [Batrachochytrium dendrobatidis JEL423]
MSREMEITKTDSRIELLILISKMSFSSAIVLTDLNDFITPSQACIKPTLIKTVADSKSISTVQSDSLGNYYEVTKEGTQTKLEAAAISLTDCLSCSGCVTSAEAILITQQSHKEIYNTIEANSALAKDQRAQICISICPQSRASLAAKYNLTTRQIRRRLTWFFKDHFKMDHVLDTAFSRDFALLESAHEFVRRYKARSDTSLLQHMPMITSACPGWICYAEKTHSAILPLIDTTKSPQQIMGSLVKDYYANQLNVNPDRIYHITVMPCYDKKLEASRQDFYNDIYKTRDVDCVISTGEVERMIQEEGLDISTMQETEEDLIFGAHGRSEGSSSGGYLAYVMRFSAKALFGVDLTPLDIQEGTNGITIVAGRNPDSTDVLFTPPGFDEPALRFAYSYGFRNIQNLIRKVKPGKPATTLLNPRRVRSSIALASGKYNYVEVMACPSGCINGGGQLKPEPQLKSEKTQTFESKDSVNTIELDLEIQSTAQPPLIESTASASSLTTDGTLSGKQWISRAESMYRSADESIELPETNAVIKRLYAEWLGGEDTEKSRKMLHTGYHSVEPLTSSTTAGLITKW